MNDSVCAAIVACSDALAAERKGEIERLCAILKKHDINAELISEDRNLSGEAGDVGERS